MQNKTLIIQPLIPPYRMPFFQSVAEEIGGVDILHFGRERVFSENNINESLGTYCPLKSIKIIKNLKKEIKNYDTIICMFDPHWLNLFILPFVSNKKIIFWGHGFGKNNLIYKVRICLAKKAHAIITYNQSGKIKFVNSGIASKKIFVANNTIQVTNHQDTSDRIKNSFIYVGRLQRRKKLDLFFPILKELIVADNSVVLNIIGDGDEEKSFLKEQAKQYGLLSRVNFISGTNDESALKNLFAQAYAYISPGAVGLGIIHSFAYGVPVYTIEDVMHGPEISNLNSSENGYLAKNEEEYKEAILEDFKEQRMRVMGAFAYEHYLESCKMSAMVDSFKRALSF